MPCWYTKTTGFDPTTKIPFVREKREKMKSGAESTRTVYGKNTKGDPRWIAIETNGHSYKKSESINYNGSDLTVDFEVKQNRKTIMNKRAHGGHKENPYTVTTTIITPDIPLTGDPIKDKLLRELVTHQRDHVQEHTPAKKIGVNLKLGAKKWFLGKRTNAVHSGWTDLQTRMVPPSFYGAKQGIFRYLPEWLPWNKRATPPEHFVVEKAGKPDYHPFSTTGPSVRTSNPLDALFENNKPQDYNTLTELNKRRAAMGLGPLPHKTL
jgi:hypothetical protein